MLKERKLLEYIGKIQEERIELLKNIEQIAMQQQSWIKEDIYDLFEKSMEARSRKIERTEYIVSQFDDANNQLKASYNYSVLQNEVAYINHNQEIVAEILKSIVSIDGETQLLLASKKNEAKNAMDDIRIKRKVSTAYKSAEIQKDGVFIDKYK